MTLLMQHKANAGSRAKLGGKTMNAKTMALQKGHAQLARAIEASMEQARTTCSAPYTTPAATLPLQSLRCVVLCCVVLCGFVALCCVMLCCVMLCYVV